MNEQEDKFRIEFKNESRVTPETERRTYHRIRRFVDETQSRGISGLRKYCRSYATRKEFESLEHILSQASLQYGPRFIAENQRSR